MTLKKYQNKVLLLIFLLALFFVPFSVQAAEYLTITYDANDGTGRTKIIKYLKNSNSYSMAGNDTFKSTNIDNNHMNDEQISGWCYEKNCTSNWGTFPVFATYYKNDDRSGQKYNELNSQSNITLYAKWEKRQDISQAISSITITGDNLNTDENGNYIIEDKKDFEIKFSFHTNTQQRIHQLSYIYLPEDFKNVLYDVSKQQLLAPNSIPIEVIDGTYLGKTYGSFYIQNDILYIDFILNNSIPSQSLFAGSLSFSITYSVTYNKKIVNNKELYIATVSVYCNGDKNSQTSYEAYPTGKILIKYIDTNTKEEIKQEKTYTDYIGNVFELDFPKISGYTIVNKPNKTTYEFEEELQTIYLNYSKVEKNQEESNIIVDNSISDSIIIESIEINKKSESVKELSPAVITDNKIKLDVKMYDVGDYIEYILKIKNISNDDYYLDNNFLNINSNYFDFSPLYEDVILIKPNIEKEIAFKIEYKKEVEKEFFFSGNYVEKKKLTVDLTNKKDIFDVITNPNTGIIHIFFIIVIIVISGIIYIFYKRKKYPQLLCLIMGVVLLTPISIYAIAKKTIVIDSNITIGRVKDNPCIMDETLIQGIEYINGQYTYRYMQEFDGSSWINIENDGWGVTLTDKTSSENVTSKLCTSINDKPIVSMANMYFGSQTSYINLDSLDTSNVINMNKMFDNVLNVEELDLSSFNTKNVQFMNNMFSNMTSLQTLDLHYFDTSSTKTINEIFSNDTNINEINMDNWDITQINSGGIFNHTHNLKKVSMKNWKLGENVPYGFGWSWAANNSPLEILDVTGWDLSKTKNLTALFAGLKSLLEITGLETWDTSKIVSFEHLFNGDESINMIDLHSFDSTSVKNMSLMFFNCKNLELIDLSGFDTSNVENMSYMFSQSNNLKTILVSYDFTVENVFNDNNMFYETRLLTGGNGTIFDPGHTNKEYARIDKENEPGYFTHKLRN